MRCAILEDEQLSVNLLTDYVSRVPGLSLAASFTSPLSAKRWLSENEVDLLFLDIELPEFSGLEMLRMLDRVPPTIITSADSRYALESYEYLVMDYLLKPFSLGRFVQAVEKASRLAPLAVPADPAELEEALSIREGHRLLRIPFERILWVESFGEYVRIHTPDRVLMPHLSLTGLEAMLPARRFLRIHRSRIVNLEHFEGLEGQVVRIRGQGHPVGRKYRPGLLERLKRRWAA